MTYISLFILTMATSDEVIWNEAIDRPVNLIPFSDKQRLWVQDQSTGGIYNGTIQYDLSTWANSGLYSDWSNANLVVPYVVSVKGVGTTDISSSFNKDSIVLKSGYYHLLDQIQVEVNNKTLVNQSQNVNVMANFKTLATLSESDYIKLAPVLGLGIDTPDSFTYTKDATGSINGDGYCNNSSSNLGFTQRASYTSTTEFVNNNADINELPTVIGNTANAPAADKKTNAIQVYGSEGRNFFVKSGDGASAIFHYIFIAVIKLKDLCPMMNFPISRGLNVRLTINYNSFKGVYNATTDKLKTVSYQQASGTTCPVMMAPLKSNATVNGDFEVVGNVISNSISIQNGSGVPTLPFNSTRIYIDSYKLNAEYQATLLKNMPVTTVNYLDYYSYPISPIQAGQTFNQIVSNGIPALRCCFILPFASPVSDVAKGVTEWANIFDSAPATSCPSAPVENLNILVGGVQVFSQNQTYSFENYLSEVQHLFALNGGNINAVNSGLISKKMFEGAYRMYCAWLGRKNPVEDMIPKSLQIQGTNGSKTTMSYTVIAFYEKSITLNTATGEILATVP